MRFRCATQRLFVILAATLATTLGCQPDHVARVCPATPGPPSPGRANQLLFGSPIVVGGAPAGYSLTNGFGSVGDANGDGKADVVFLGDKSGNDELAIYLGHGDGTFESAVMSWGHNSALWGKLLVGDVDADCLPDVLVATGDLKIVPGRSDGTLDAPAQLATIHYSVASADFNHDGLPDLATIYMDQAVATVNVMLMQSDRLFAPAQAYGLAGETAFGLVAGDFNGDGHPDLLAARDNYGPTPEGLRVLLGNGDGTFRTPPVHVQEKIVLRFEHYMSTALAVADLNGDHRDDVVLAATWSQDPAMGALVLLGQADGSFTTSVLGEVGSSVAIDDLDGDGTKDIVLAGTQHGARVYLGRGDGTFREPVDFPGSYVEVHTALIDADARPDLVFFEGGQVTILPNQSR